MEKFREFINKHYVCLIVAVIYLYIICHQPNLYNFHHDEIHACNIAKNFSFLEIIKLMRAEGHTFLWFFITKPFLSIQAFPYWIIKIINLIFIFLGLGILWIKAPLAKLTKILITFSFPFLYLYSMFARCYGIGILLLFILTALYKDKFKHPFIYLTLVFLAANTSLVTGIGAGAFGLMFLWDSLKNKNWKLVFLAIATAIITLLSLYIQWHDYIIPGYSQSYTFWGNLFWTIPYSNKNILLGIFLVVLATTILGLFRSKPALFFILFGWAGLLFVFNKVYCGWAHHHHIMYIYLIIAFWLHNSTAPNKSTTKTDKFFNICYMVFILIFSFVSLYSTFKLPKQNLYLRWDILPQQVLNKIGENKTLHILSVSNGTDLIAYSDKFDLKDFHGNPIITFDNFLYIYAPKPEKIELLELQKNATPDSYILISPNDAPAISDYEAFQAKNKPILSITRVFAYRKTFLLYKLK